MLVFLISAAVFSAIHYWCAPLYLEFAELWETVFSGLIATEIVLLVLLNGYTALQLNRAASKSTNGKPIIQWLPWASTMLFAVLVTLLHFAAWIPVLYAALMVSPIVFLPPLIYRVMHDRDEAPLVKPLFNLEETCRMQDNAFSSEMIRQFMARYPEAKTYLYKTNLPHKAGGLLLHSRERLPNITQTFIEVTLDCPFTHKAGVLAEGREVLHAYLARHPKSGSIISPLPHKDWEEWLKGLSEKDWLSRIEDMSGMKPTHEPLQNRPVHFVDRLLNAEWMPIRLTI